MSKQHWQHYLKVLSTSCGQIERPDSYEKVPYYNCEISDSEWGQWHVVGFIPDKESGGKVIFRRLLVEKETS